jgi:uncharacterized protein YukE
VEPGITVRLDEVGALAAQLSALAGELQDSARTCRSAAARLRGALGGDEGWRADAVATAWARLVEVLGERAGAVAATLASATVSYADADAALAGSMTPPSVGRPR